MKHAAWNSLWIALLIILSLGRRAEADDALAQWHFRTNQPLTKVRFVGGIFIGLGRNGMLMTSSNGVEWTARQTGTTAQLYGAAYGDVFSPGMPAVYVVVGARATILSSTNAADWTLNPTTNTCDLNDVAYTPASGGRFVAVATRASANDPNALRSDGQTNWTRVNFPNGPGYVSSIAPVGPYLVAAGGSQLVLDVWRSSSGSSWVRVTNSQQAVSGIGYGQGRGIMVGMQGWPFVTINDGNSWFSSTNALFGYDMIATDIAYGNGTFLVARYMNPLLTTADGISWRSIPLVGRNWSVAYGNGTFVIVGDDGIYQSEWLAVPRITPKRDLAASGLTLMISGEIGRGYRLQNSSNLLNWSDYVSYTNVDAMTNVLVPVLPDLNQFYRVVTP